MRYFVFINYLLLFFLLSGCSNVHKPMINTIHTAREVNDLRINASVDVSNVVALNLSTAYSPINHLGLNSFVSYSRNNEIYGFAAGYYTSKFSQTKFNDRKGYLLDYYGGYMFQKRTLRTYDSFQGRASINKYFGQVAYHYFFGFSDFSIAYKASLLDVSSISVTTRDLFYDPTYLDRLISKPHVFHTLTTSMALGFESYKLHGSATFGLNKSSYLEPALAAPLTLYAGIIININTMPSKD